MLSRKNFILYALLWTFLVCKAETETFRFAHITKDNGLAQNHVTCIMQDDKGFMWIGTKSGLCKYNGYSIQTYLHNMNDSSSLSHNFIRSIFQDKNKRIWIGTDNGLCRYLPEQDKFANYGNFTEPVTSFAETNDSTLYCSAGRLFRYNDHTHEFTAVEVGTEKARIEGTYVLAVDSKNTLWIGGSNGLIGYSHDFSKSKEVNIVEPGLQFEQGDKVISLFIDHDNHNIWVGKQGNGIVCYNAENDEICHYGKKDELPNGVVRAIGQDTHNRIWLGTEKGLSILKRDGNIRNIQQNYDKRFGLNDNAIYAIEKDRDGNMWIGTYFGGINVFFKAVEQFNYYPAGYADGQLKGKALRQIISGTGATLWIATEDGGLNRFDKTTGTFTRWQAGNIQSDNIHSLQTDREGTLWIGTFWGGLTKYDLKTGQSELFNTLNCSFKDNNIFSLYADRDGILWIGTSSGLRYFNKSRNSIERLPNDFLSENFIFCIKEDRHGNLWIGTRSQGLACYNKRSGVVRTWKADSGTNDLSDNFITSILEDSDGTLWIGTNNGGLYRYRKETDDFHSLFRQGSVSEQCIYGLVEDNDKNLWITSNNGLLCYSIPDGKSIRYTTEEGLPTNHFNYASAFKDQDGIIYMGTIQGMISFDPRQVHQETTFPNIVLTGLSIGNKAITPQSPDSPLKRELDNTTRITLKHKQAQFVGIEYTGIALGHSQNIVYAVQMEGLNPEWQIMNGQRQIVFSHLPAGKYIFRVKASSVKNTWDDSNIRSLEIVVKPPFYFSTIAIFIYVLLLVAIILLVFRMYYRRLEEKNAIRVSQLENKKLEEMNELKRNFFTNISHEFKTPLTLITAPVQRMMNEPDIPEKARRNLELVLKNANSLMNLVHELIAFNKIEAKQTQIKLQKGNPMNFIREICNRFQVLALEEDIHFQVEIEDLDEEVWFGLTAVEKIINNLLSNAFKYTPQGGDVTLAASITEDEHDKLFLKIAVTDTGIGIAPENQERVFNAYYQEQREKNGKKPGFGIGLSLTKSLVLLHKGNIQLESKPGEGSRFTVLLDVSPDAFPAESRLELRADQNYLEKYNYASIVSEEQLQLVARNENDKMPGKAEILIVEDNTEMLRFLLDIFSEKYAVRAAGNGREALDSMNQKLPDLLISDIMMPEMDGNELCRQVKSNLLTSHIPVVLVTAKTGTDNIIKGYELGADVYVEKPFNPQSLLLQVQNLLRTRDNNRKQFKESNAQNISLVARNKYDEKLLNDIKKVVEENIGNEEFSVSDVIKAVGISRTMLHVKLKSMLDMSIGDYIRNIRIERAKELLLQGDTIADTAYATGFTDPNYFSKCFKKQTGQTPSEFIKGHRGE